MNNLEERQSYSRGIVVVGIIIAKWKHISKQFKKGEGKHVKWSLMVMVNTFITIN